MSDEQMVVVVPPSQSASIAALAGALAKAQGSIAGAVKDSENPFFKSRYADLASVWDACRKPLSDNKLAVIQLAKASTDGVTVTTILAHESGEWISEALTLPLKDQTPQAVGSALTYGRRYGLSAMVGIAPEDDDAEGAMPARPSNGQSQTNAHSHSSAAPERPLGNYISEPQGNRMKAIARQVGWKEHELEAFLAKKGIGSVQYIPKGRYDALVKEVEQGSL